MFDSTILAYAAGYVDGDGCFFIRQNRGKFRSEIIINSVSLENVEWFQKLFGGTIREIPRIKTHKILYRYVINSEWIEPFYAVGNYLVEKKKQFDAFRQFRIATCKEDKILIIEKMKVLKNESDLVSKSMKPKLHSIRNTIEPNIEDIAYLAGFIDAECCLCINKHKPKNRPNPVYKILLQCNNSKAPCFYWIAERFGGHFHFIDRSKFITPHRNQICWRISAASLQPILKKVYPFLNHKKPVCKELLNFYETTFRRTGNPSPNSFAYTDFYRPILNKREEIFHNVKALNKKGI